MKIEAHDTNGKVYTQELPDSAAAALDSLAENNLSRTDVQRLIDNLSISADAKAILNSIAKTTVVVGNKIIQIGTKILQFVRDIFKAYPKATFGLILGLVLSALVAAIPVIGFLFGGLILPVAAAFGLVSGWMEDMKDSALLIKIQAVTANFSPLAAN